MGEKLSKVPATEFSFEKGKRPSKFEVSEESSFENTVICDEKPFSIMGKSILLEADEVLPPPDVFKCGIPKEEMLEEQILERIKLEIKEDEMVEILRLINEDAVFKQYENMVLSGNYCLDMCEQANDSENVLKTTSSKSDGECDNASEKSCNISVGCSNKKNKDISDGLHIQVPISENNLKTEHEEAEEKSSVFRYKCPLCSYSTKYIRYFQQHLPKHAANEKLFVCQLCKEDFPEFSDLRTHRILAHIESDLVDEKSNGNLSDYKISFGSSLDVELSNETGDGTTSSKRHYASKKNAKPQGNSHGCADFFVPYRCHLCSFSTLYQITLKRHFAVHAIDEKPLLCQACQECFSQSDDLRKHLSEVHGDRSMATYQQSGNENMEANNGIFPRSENSNNSSKNMELDTPTPNAANVNNDNTGRLKIFKQEEIDISCYEDLIPQFSCFICPFSTNFLPFFKKHFLQHVKEKKFDCLKCNVKFDDYENFRQHRFQIHEDDISTFHFSCSLCSYSTSSLNSVEAHLDIHLKKGKHSSQSSPKYQSVFKSRKPLFAGSKQQQNICDLCERKFDKRTELWHHRRLHILKLVNQHACEMCQATFSRSNDLKRHRMSVHFQEKSYVCSVCKKGFSRAFLLKRHQSTVHHKERH